MKVTALEFQRGFGRVRAMAQRAPVVITHHGRDDLVLLSADDYARLKTGASAATGARAIEQDTLSIARAFKALVEQKWDVERVVLFGSRARGDHRMDSDIDVAVILRGKKGDHVSTMLQMNALAYDLSLEAGLTLQPVPVWKTEWADPDSHENPPLIRNMQKEGVPV